MWSTTVNAYRVSVHLQQNSDNQVMIFNHKHMLQHFSSSHFSLFCHCSVFHLFLNLYHPCLSFYMSPWRFAVVKAIYPAGSLSPLGAFQDNAVKETFFCLCHLSVREREREREGDQTIFHVTSRNKTFNHRGISAVILPCRELIKQPMNKHTDTHMQK